MFVYELGNFLFPWAPSLSWMAFLSSWPNRLAPAFPRPRFPFGVACGLLLSAAGLPAVVPFDSIIPVFILAISCPVSTWHRFAVSRSNIIHTPSYQALIIKCTHPPMFTKYIANLHNNSTWWCACCYVTQVLEWNDWLYSIYSHWEEFHCTDCADQMFINQNKANTNLTKYNFTREIVSISVEHIMGQSWRCCPQLTVFHLPPHRHLNLNLLPNHLLPFQLAAWDLVYNYR